MIFFSLYTCSCCCVSTICFFFKHFSANVFGFPSPIFFELANCTSSTLPNPPTPKVARISKSFSRRPSNSNQNKKNTSQNFFDDIVMLLCRMGAKYYLSRLLFSILVSQFYLLILDNPSFSIHPNHQPTVRKI